MPMELSVLLEGFIEKSSLPSLSIVSIEEDSRNLQKGSLFLALQGEKHDGHSFIEKAFEKGAVFVVAEKGKNPLPQHPFVAEVSSTQNLWAPLCKRFYGAQLTSLLSNSFGITGTNGKTTTSYLLEAILQNANRHPALIGTVGNRCGKFHKETGFTTPTPTLLWKSLHELHQHSAESLIMEVSSHALVQKRIEGLRFQVAGFTNITQDHLDFHNTMEEYMRAKSLLFSDYLQEKGTAIINADDPMHSLFAKASSQPVWTYSTHQTSADFFAQNTTFTAKGIQTTLHTPQGTIDVHLSMIGSYNLSNVLLATGMAMAGGVSLSTIQESLEALPQVPGRLEKVMPENEYAVFVDYAHTPDALEKVLQTLRPLCQGKLLCVFGCGGDRDKTKRPWMGKIAMELADLCIVTSDNPRTEDPFSILQDILSGMQETQKKNPYHVEIHREQAIFWAIQQMTPQDILCIAGKGHETYQIIGTQKMDFDDRKVAQKALLQKETHSLKK